MRFVKHYNITAIDTLGKEFKVTIAAPTLDEALSKVGTTKYNLVNSSVVYKIKSAIDFNVQLQIITRIIGGAQSGEFFTQYIPNIISDFKELKPKQNHIKQLIDKKGTSLSQILNELDLHPLVSHIVASGEASDGITNSLKTAKNVLRLEKQTVKATKSTLKKESLSLLIFIGLLFLGPWGAVYYFDLMQEIGTTIPHNISTNILFMLYEVNIYLALVLIGVMTFYFTKKSFILNLLKDIYPFSIFINIGKTKDSILFLSIFSPLYNANSRTEQIIQSYKKTDYQKALLIEQKIKQGLGFSDAIQDVGYSATLKQGFKGFNRISDFDSKKELLKELFLSLQDDIEVLNERASIFISALSYNLSWGMVIILIHGLMMPQLQIGVMV
jgi:hypothetical protein